MCDMFTQPAWIARGRHRVLCDGFEKEVIMRARFAFALLFAVSSFSLACSSSSSDNGSSDTGSGGTDSGSGDVGHDSNVVDTHDSAPLMCWIGHPQDSSAQTCDTCSFDKCKDKWVAAYGTNYLSDDFTGGTCKDNATCNCACAEADKICQENCDVSTESPACHDAKAAIDSCEKTNCTTICGFDVIDSGTDGDSASGG
jgi:hypothetical protein